MHVERVEREGIRYYKVIDNNNEYYLNSVSNIISKYKDKTGLIKWRENIGEEKAKEITEFSTNRGNNIHQLVENYFLGKDLIYQTEEEKFMFNKLNPILESIEPIYIEKELYWINKTGLGFGGTVDICGKISTDIFYSKDDYLELPQYFYFIGDWKTWRKPKYPKQMTKDKTYYYPLLSYCLQISAYCAAINQRTEKKYKINKGLIFGITPKEKQPYVYYFDANAIKFYWNNMLELVFAYSNNDEFDWHFLEEMSNMNNVLGTRLYLKK